MSTDKIKLCPTHIMSCNSRQSWTYQLLRLQITHAQEAHPPKALKSTQLTAYVDNERPDRHRCAARLVKQSVSYSVTSTNNAATKDNRIVNAERVDGVAVAVAALGLD